MVAMAAKRLPQTPIYLDGMAANIVHALKGDPEHILWNWFRPGYPVQAFHSDNQRREVLFGSDPFIIIAGAGMMEGGAILRYFAELAEDTFSKIVSVGYQHPSTFGYEVRHAQRGDTLQLPAEITSISSGERAIPSVRLKMARAHVPLSSHADREQLLRFIGGVQAQFPDHPVEFALIHGDSQAKTSLRTEFRLAQKKVRFVRGFEEPGDELEYGPGAAVSVPDDLPQPEGVIERLMRFVRAGDSAFHGQPSHHPKIRRKPAAMSAKVRPLVKPKHEPLRGGVCS
jgi:predicted metal-dependent RNase